MKENSTHVLTSAIEGETESREKNTLTVKAARDKLFVKAQTVERREFIKVLEDRDHK